MQTKIYKGWMNFCPIYIEDPESGEPTIWPRHWCLEPVLWLALQVQYTTNYLGESLYMDWDPGFRIWIGKRVR